jgi:hypothetical protein
MRRRTRLYYDKPAIDASYRSLYERLLGDPDGAAVTAQAA